MEPDTAANEAISEVVKLEKKGEKYKMSGRMIISQHVTLNHMIYLATLCMSTCTKIGHT